MTLHFERKNAKIRIQKLLSNVSKKLNNVMLNRLTSVALLLAMFPATLVSTTSNNSQNTTFSTKIKLNLDLPTVLASDSSSSVIVPGESQTEREARIAAEEETKKQEAAKALALAAARNTVSRDYRVYTDPSNFDEIYARAESAYGVDASILKAIHIVETGASGSTSRTNSSGATGPMQFLPSTWKNHAVDGNNDGIKDINNVEDAIFSAAAYLKACGFPDVKKALWGYNPSTSYYNKVISIARSLGYNK